MRIIYVTARADHGGGPRHLELLLKNLPSEVEAHIACPNDFPYWTRFSNVTNGRICVIPHRSIGLRALLSLVSYVRCNEIDIIHTHGKGAGFYGRFLAMATGKLCVHTPHGVHVERYGILSKWLYCAYENLTSCWIKQLIFVSAEERVSARAHRLWPRTRFSVIPNGVNPIDGLGLLRMRRSMRASLGIADDSLVVLTLSRFDYQKNMLEAYQVVKAFPTAIFLWAGDGDDAADLTLQAQADDVGNLRFLGSLDDPAEVMAAADIYLSTSRWEGLPLAVLEAMASGLAVVASDVTGHREVVGESGGGLLYPCGSPEKAVDALAELSDNRALLRKMGDRGRHVQRASYSAEKMAEQVMVIYEQLVLEKAGG